MSEQVWCRCPGRWLWQIAQIELCFDCHRWICVDCRERHDCAEATCPPEPEPVLLQERLIA